MILRVGEFIRGEDLRLRSQDGIHSRCEVVDCTLDIADPAEVFLYCSIFRSTTIKVAKTMTKGWYGCFFDSCTFLGRYYACYFGADALDSRLCTLKAGLKDCDFTKATLNLCAFLNCTPEDLRLPDRKSVV